MKKNLIANAIGKFWGFISGFLFIPLYIKFLGFESYAVISFTLIITGLMAVLDAGLTATLSREFARKDKLLSEKWRVFKTLETCYFLIVTFISIVIFSFSNAIAANWMNVKTIDSQSLSLFIKIIGFETGFQMLFRFYMGGVLGFEKQIKANVIQIGFGIVRNGLVVLAIWLIPSLEMFFWWQLASTIIFTIIIRAVLLRILYGKWSYGFKPALEKEVFSNIWRFTLGMLLISVVAALNTQMDKLTISKLLNISTLGHYTLAVSVAMGIYLLVSPVSVALLPRFTALYSQNEPNAARELYKKINLFVAVLLFSCMAIMIFHRTDLIWIWTGNIGLAKEAGAYLPVLTVSYVMLALAAPAFDIAVANGYTKLNNMLGIISLFVTLPGYWFATKLYGGIGAAYVFCIVQTVSTFVYLYLINRKFLNISFRDLWLRNIIFPLMISVSIGYALSLIPNIFAETRTLSLVRIGVLSFITIIGTVMIVVPLRDIKAMLKVHENNSK